jgi:hypothetical protein
MATRTEPDDGDRVSQAPARARMPRRT